jgi:Tol biopolymer transport system component
MIARFRGDQGATTWRKNHPHPAFSPDGKRIYYNVNSGKYTQLFVAERSRNLLTD